jgi:prepilin-type N-terminal cleavage/methylation domain-containing protein
MFKKLLKKTEKGFTIIEVMIVLAIAGLILVVVLIAVPQLQRNQRNEARRSLAGRIVTEINNFGGNNNGTYPVANTASAVANFGTASTATGFMNRYMGCTQPGGVAACTTNINDPQTSFPVGTGLAGTATTNTTTAAISGGALAEVGAGTGDAVSPGATAGDIYYATGALCNGESAVVANARNFAFIIRLEGGAGYCLDNR